MISDLHLEPGRPDITNQFLQFLSGPARQADQLFILGDLFEVWLGDDAAGPFEQKIAQALNQLAQSGVALYFICGNRDFMLGEEYCQQAGMKLLHEPEMIDLYGTRCVLLHGDVLCTDDLDYQRLRQRLQNPDWKASMLKRPVWLRRFIAGLLRRISRFKTGGKADEIMDVTKSTVLELFETSQAARMIHGHTHRPARHHYRQNSLERIVLGDWHRNGSMIRVSANGAELIELSR